MYTNIMNSRVLGSFFSTKKKYCLSCYMQGGSIYMLSATEKFYLTRTLHESQRKLIQIFTNKIAFNQQPCKVGYIKCVIRKQQHLSLMCVCIYGRAHTRRFWVSLSRSYFTDNSSDNDTHYDPQSAVSFSK